MFIYDKKLQYPVKIANPNPRLAGIIISSTADRTESWVLPCGICPSGTVCPSTN